MSAESKQEAARATGQLLSAFDPGLAVSSGDIGVYGF